MDSLALYSELLKIKPYFERVPVDAGLGGKKKVYKTYNTSKLKHIGGGHWTENIVGGTDAGVTIVTYHQS